MIPRFKSILSRIVVLHIVAVVATSIAMSLALSWLLTVATNNLHNTAMRDQAIALTNSIRVRNGELILTLPPELQGLYAQPYGRYSYAVLDQAGRVLLSSRPDRTAVFPNAVGRGDEIFTQRRRGDAMISGVSLRTTIDNKTVTIQTAEDLANRDVLTDDITRGFFRDVGWITLPILLSLVLIDIVIFRRALQPLRLASAIAQKIGPTRTDLRLPLDDIPSEVLPLMSAVNLALDRLENGFRLQREFTADAAHELRTPLSVLRAHVDMIADKAVAIDLRDDIEGMSRIISQLLDIAEMEAMVLDPYDVADLQAVCANVVSFVAPIAIAQNKTVALLGTENAVLVKGNAEMLTRAIRNLADNAIAHTPPGTTVEFSVKDTGVVVTRDYGPGISEDELELIFQRFWRRDRNRAGSTGLGLSIVNRVVQLHGGSIVVSKAKGGGAEFSLAIPCIESGPAR